MKKERVNYALYLVTDSTPAILGDRNIVDVVEAAVYGGVSCVQFRDKTSDTGELIRIARELHKFTSKYDIPLLINDRVDVALAVGCEGVHIGQDDMDLQTARQLLGPDAIIGVTAGTLEEAIEACEGGADYLGIGTVYATPTKTNTKHILGPEGVRSILDGLYKAGYDNPAVCIGGINASNIQSVVSECKSLRGLNGVAVVSAIMAAKDPELEAARLYGLLRDVQLGELGHLSWHIYDYDVHRVAGVIEAVNNATPLSHNMTNLVVQNFAANVALAVGASPIMSNNGEEAADLAKLGGALVVNMGTVTPDGLQNYVKALKAYNQAGRPVVFDPVGAGATSVRRSAVKTIMGSGFIDVIKGNEGEIKTVYDETGPSGASAQAVQQRGVDSTSVLSRVQKARLVLDLARRQGNVVVMTGKRDFVSDGELVVTVNNGHEYLGMVTGTGCVLAATISAMVAVSPKEDRLLAVLAGILLFEIAAEVAAARPDVRGPGTFVPAFIDELARLRRLTAKGDVEWLDRARVKKEPQVY